MALKTINLGSQANDGTGDDLREAFEKVIFNFAELDSRSPEATTVTNLGAGEGVFSNINGADIRLKSIVAGDNVTLTADGNSIRVDVDAGVTQFDVEGDSGSYTITEGGTISIIGGRLTRTERSGNSLQIESEALGAVSDDLTPELSGTLNANGHSITSAGTINASQFQGPLNGNVTGLVHGIDIRDINSYRQTNSWDFGTIGATNITNIFDWVFLTYDVDLGTIITPTPLNLNAGTINTPLI
jgi:uncharacterized protein with beta-barrel porin domain